MPNRPLEDLVIFGLMQDLAILKQKVHGECLRLVQERIAALEQSIEETRSGAEENSKSSAGDKHETARAMADLEIEKQQASLKNLLLMQAALKQIDPQPAREKIGAGTLIKTNQGLFYITVALGKIKTDQQEILAISAGAPIVKALQLYPEKNPVVFNGRTYTVEEII